MSGSLSFLILLSTVNYSFILVLIIQEISYENCSHELLFLLIISQIYIVSEVPYLNFYFQR